MGSVAPDMEGRKESDRANARARCPPDRTEPPGISGWWLPAIEGAAELVRMAVLAFCSLFVGRPRRPLADD
jgi:hypothetical protein